MLEQCTPLALRLLAVRLMTPSLGLPHQHHAATAHCCHPTSVTLALMPVSSERLGFLPWISMASFQHAAAANAMQAQSIMLGFMRRAVEDIAMHH